MLSKVDPRVLKRLNIEKKDHGIDLLLKHVDGRYAALQCKFTNDQSKKNLTWTGSRLSSWLAASTKSDIRILFTNASGVSLAVKNKASEKEYHQFSYSDLASLAQDEVQAILDSIHNRKPQRIVFKPRDHQREAIKSVTSKFKKFDRGKLILPCGSGKTLTSLWIKEKLRPGKTLVLVPSLSLLRQFKNDWKAQEKNRSEFFCVCSESDIAGKDSVEESVAELAAKVTTDHLEIRGLLGKKNDLVVYSTYQSSPQIAKAMENTKLKFDLVVCDEAHRTAGEKLSNFATVLDDKKIKASKRLFMTATPRIVSDKIKNNEEAYNYLYDMSNEDHYGPEFFALNFGDAIARKPAFLSDYKILAVGVEDEELKKWIKERKIAKNTTIDEIANNFALDKVMKKVGATHALTFHSRVSSAKEFCERHQEMYPRSNVWHVSGKQSSNERALVLDDFKGKKKGIVANARCLTEGVDVPAIDLVYFCDPKNSKIDIVQATGRALRKSPGKKLGYIVVPIFHKNKDEVEDAIDSGVFKNLITVIRAMADQDSRIEEEILRVKYGKGKRRKSSPIADLNLAEAKIIELTGFEVGLKKSLFSQAISKSVVKWRPYKWAQKFASSCSLKSAKQWYRLCANGGKPEDIPQSPDRIYSEEWKGWGEFLGTGNIANYNKVFQTFEESRKFVQSLNLSGQKEWFKYRKSGKLPDDIPRAPETTYKEEWKGYGDFLGTNVIAPRLRKYRPFKESRAFVRSLNLKGSTDWKEFRKSDKRPEDIPTNPHIVYKNEWEGMGDFLGTRTVAPQLRKYQSFGNARAFAKKLKLGNAKEWYRFCKEGKKPEDIPQSPDRIYKKEWKGWGDFLGTGNIAAQQKKFRSFKDARSFVRSLKLKSETEWRKYSKSEQKPSDIPSTPSFSYKEEWKGWGDFLGTGNVQTQKKQFVSFSKAKAFVKKHGIKSQSQWREYCRSGKVPPNIPKKPEKVYKDQWKGIGDFLGTGVIAPRLREYRSFSEARKFVRRLKLKNKKQWKEFCDSGKLPRDIPKAPHLVFKTNWLSWADWLGY
ncbi:MAG: DEAD/DEAH box helicase family protein [Bdellovibrionales bacterium]|nr:DEAD/DEAH box helicase family protein [Bdellovibrionales bacterium]